MLLDTLKTIVGPKGWTTDAADMAPRLVDWRKSVRGRSPIIVSPANVDEVAAVVRACASEKIGIVPQGGNTGMCAGAIPDESGEQVVLSLARMNTIRHIDAENFSMEVEAGCILADIQAAASSHGRHFALSLGAEGSCQIGGNLATNAGGINVIRYGTARAQVLGLEVVLADGSIVNSLRALRKDTAGYDLKQNFIGSEGTLGIITAATLKLFPDPGPRSTALIALPASGDAVCLLARLRTTLGDSIEAFELVSAYVFSLLEAHVPGCKLPFDAAHPWYVLTDVTGPQRDDVLEKLLHDSANDGLISDAVLAKNGAEAEAFWRMRHSIAEAERAAGKAQKHDISVPVSRIEDFLSRGDKMLATIAPEARLIAFGHVGDGNLHYNVALPANSTDGERITTAVYDLVSEFGGSISAEHGIGTVKKQYLSKYRSETELAVMRTLKNALDPHNILNPGKVI
tara:strand:- start:171 stop:1541 length:1371 start_codon:yes stop_codon:yes gene_type:complete